MMSYKLPIATRINKNSGVTDSLIVGFWNLKNYVGVGECVLRRAFKLYDFPQPICAIREGRSLRMAWDESEVLEWMTKYRVPRGRRH